ncbi:MAG TPA: flagellar basal-body rod protein FlgF [Hyphomicrobiaceae bacterium]|jgi:flagellar basal-body rod protein FlgF|nr:flagellar basal-body rod protein FlgF [Hyphomicrobiaceae bacterium]
MQSNLYVSLSAQMSLQKRLETIAHNLANASTAGFRAEEVKFESVLSLAAPDPVAFASAGSSFISRQSGEFVRTDNALDVAVEGNAWLAIATPTGRVFTRDGRMRMTDAGELKTLNGYAIQDAGGAPIRLDPNAGPPRIARDGTITQNDRQVGALGLFTIDAAANLTRFENSGVVPDRSAAPVLDFTKTGVQQGFIERANVNPVNEITKLIMVQRAFEAVTASIKDSETSLQDAIRSLGSNG